MISRRQFVLRLAAWLAFTAPVAYVAYICAVIVHEVIGHGLTAWMLGGSFTGFAVFPDGMGYATAWSNEHQNIVLAGGTVVGIVLGIAFMIGAASFQHPLVRMSLLLFAAGMLEDVIPYAFWSSLYARPPGDLARIIIDLDSQIIRWTLAIGFGIAFMGSTIAINILTFRCLESNLGSLSRKRAALIAWVGFGIVGGAAWFTFDWNQLVEDVGRLPQFVGAGMQLAMAPLLVFIRREGLPRLDVSNKHWVVGLVTAWMLLLALLIVLIGWLQHGIEW